MSPYNGTHSIEESAGLLLSLSSPLAIPMTYALYGGHHICIGYIDTQLRIVAALECFGLRVCTPLSFVLRRRILRQKCGVQNVRMKV